MKYQRKNGSLFNSSSATEAAVHLQYINCLNYLNSVSEKFGNSVPTTYPLDIHVSLSVVDNVESLGIDRHFKGEIQILLDIIYRNVIFVVAAACNFLEPNQNNCSDIAVDYALKFPFYAQLERVENNRNVEHYNSDNLSVLKTTYRSSNIESKDFLELAVEDFNICQSIQRKELQQLERWRNGISATDFYSENVEIIMSALQNTINDSGEEVFSRKGYRVTSQLVQMWYYNKLVPTFEEYMTNACVTITLEPIVLPALYLIGSDVPMEVLHNTEYLNLVKAMSTCGQIKAGKMINAVPLLMSSGNVTEEEALKKARGMIEKSRKELLKLVFNSKDSGIPRACKELFWIGNKQMQFLYRNDDALTGYNDGVANVQEMVNAVRNIFEERLHVPPYTTVTRMCKESCISSTKTGEPEPAPQ
ncbi:hypothetical protein MKX01_020816 [Papaver californicum]|nr:hypothetical protein MKX01_020816 [Papaver californicum]